METNSDECIFWLVRVHGRVVQKTLRDVCAQPLGAGCGVDFSNLPEAMDTSLAALPVKRLIPAVDGRGIPSTSTFCSYESEGTIFIPCSLLRVKLDLGVVRLSTLSKQLRDDEPTSAFKIKADDMDKVLQHCRFY